jgi:hypothetical protein
METAAIKITDAIEWLQVAKAAAEEEGQDLYICLPVLIANHTDQKISKFGMQPDGSLGLISIHKINKSSGVISRPVIQ